MRPISSKSAGPLNSTSHDAVSGWLANTKCQPKDLWNKAKETVSAIPGVLIADDTVISKKRSSKIELANKMYSGNEHDVVRGIGALNFLWNSTGKMEESNPFDHRIYQPPEGGETKNDHFRETCLPTPNKGA